MYQVELGEFNAVVNHVVILQYLLVEQKYSLAFIYYKKQLNYLDIRVFL